MLDTILEALDESVFTKEAKQQIRESFEDAVTSKAEALVEQKIEELDAQKEELTQELQAKIDEVQDKDIAREAELQAKIEDLEIKSEEHIQALDDKAQEHLDALHVKSQEYSDYVSEEVQALRAQEEEKIQELEEKSEEYIDFLEERADAYVLLKEEELVTRAEDYLERIVQEFVEEARESMQKSLAHKESEVLKEAFDAMIQTQGKEYQKTILESTDDAVRAEIDALKESYNEAMKEVFQLKRENASLMKMGVVSEMVSDMTIVEAERFKRLVEGIEFSTDERYVRRLKSLKESIKGHARAQEAPQAEAHSAREELITETVTPAKGTKEESFGNLFSFNHLV